ncbi:MAG: hypothetical protein ACI9WU_002514 [Myxococcota bacterium]|jgi:hypothetical protein
MSRVLVSMMLLLFCAGCHADRDALHNYLTVDYPRLTAGSDAVVLAFSQIFSASNTREERLAALERDVIAPYRKVIVRLRAHEGEGEGVTGRHVEWVTIAERQLAAFEAARGAVRDGVPMDHVRELLGFVRRDAATWQAAVATDAEAAGLRIQR